MQHYKKPVPQFADPLSKTPLYYLLSKETKKLNAAIGKGSCRTITHRIVRRPLLAALFSPDQNLIYPVYSEGLPCFLLQEALPGPGFNRPGGIRDLASDGDRPAQRRPQQHEIRRLKAVLDSALSVKSGDNPNATQNKLAFLTRHAAIPQNRILDIGCASAEVIETCCRKGSHVWGVDADPERALATSERLKLSTAYADGSFHLCIADPRYLPFTDQGFDAVLADYADVPANHVSRALSEGARVTKPDRPLLAGFSLASRLVKTIRHKDKLAQLPYNLKVMLSVASAAGVTPIWWVYGTSKAPDAFRFAQMRLLLKDAAVYTYTALFDGRNEYMVPRQLIYLIDQNKLVRQSSFSSVQIGTSRWFLLKKI